MNLITTYLRVITLATDFLLGFSVAHVLSLIAIDTGKPTLSLFIVLAVSFVAWLFWQCSQALAHWFDLPEDVLLTFTFLAAFAACFGVAIAWLNNFWNQ